MPIPLTTAITKNATHFEVTAGNLDFVGQTLTIQVNLYDAMEGLMDSKVFTYAYADLGITTTHAEAIKSRIIAKLTLEGVIN